MPLEQRFWRYVRKTDSCWLWTGATTNGGYGVINRGERGLGLVRAHRLSYEMHVGPIPEGQMACHRCDTPRCVNPAHLFLGSQSENMSDCSRKGRARGNNLRGSAHPGSKLTEPDVVAIREKRAHTSLNALAREYGVSKRTVLFVAQCRHWRHV